MTLATSLLGAGGGSALTVKDEGVTLSTAVTSIDFVGPGVTATSVGGAVTATIGVVPINPASATGLYRWFKSDTGVTMNGSNQVSAWADQSGLGGNATQATTGKMPIYTASVLDGFGGLRFTAASSQQLDFNLAGIASSAYTIYLVTGRRSASVPLYCMGAITSGSTNASLHIGWRTGSNWTLGQWANDLDLTVESYTAGRYQITSQMCHTTLGHKVEAYQQNPSTSNTSTTTLGSIPGGGTIGMAVGTYWEGDIVEIVICTAAHTYAMRQGIIAYLVARYPTAATTW